MKRGILFGVIAMAALVVAANILVQFLVGDWLTWGAFTYPFTFLVNDLMNRLYGPAAARKVVLAGFVTGIICSLIGTQIMLDFGEYSAPAVTLRIALGSGLAFLLAQLTDILVFDRLREGNWWRAPLVSSVVGSSLDTALFFTIAFSGALTFLEPANDVSWAGGAVPLLGFGPETPLWVSLATADFIVKMLLAMIALAPFRVLSSRLKPALA